MSIEEVLKEITKHFGEDCVYSGTAVKYIVDIATGDENKAVRRKLKIAFEAGFQKKMSKESYNEVRNILKDYSFWEDEIVTEVLGAFYSVLGIAVPNNVSSAKTKTKTNGDTTISKSSENKEYRIGERGPAGGWVFYDKGYKSDGWRYLETAPSDAPKTYTWADDGYYETKEGIGTGVYNTEKLAGKSKDRPVNAIEYCKNYSCNGYSDWFLPSKEELNQMYNVLHKKGLGNFANGNYWSSSETYEDDYDDDYDDEEDIYAWSQRFSSGRQSLYTCDNDLYVRAIRAF